MGSPGEDPSPTALLPARAPQGHPCSLFIPSLFFPLFPFFAMPHGLCDLSSPPRD